MNKSLRIAVADDEADIRDFLRRMLTRQGHHVVCAAENGRQLIDACREVHPDLVISDIKMPEVDGIEAADEIGREHAVPLILISAYHDSELVERAETDNVMAYLVKPISQADLQPAIALAMRRFAELQALRVEVARRPVS